MRSHVVILLLLLSAASRGQEETDRWWSLRSLRAPQAPRQSAAHPVERFLERARRERGTVRSAEADRRTLIRRASFVLHGLPPTPEEVARFEADTRPDAWERLIDRLLASPRYGERWARHWLDVAHYGDTHGFDKDKLRPNAWPYRDWVIRAFNDDLPWDRFVRMQLAGDVLRPGDPDGVIATGFIAAGPWDYVGHVELRPGTRDKKITHDLDRDDMVTTTMSSFTSLTVHCARCHDHKFDPITQAEYFGLQAVFAGVDRADRPYEDPGIARRRAVLTDEVRAAEREAARHTLRAHRTARIDSAIARRDRLVEMIAKQPSRGAPTSPSNGWHSAIERSPDVTKWVEVDLGTEMAISQIRIWPARPTDFRDTPGFGFPESLTVTTSGTKSDVPRVVARVERGSERGDVPLTIDLKGSLTRRIRLTGHRLWKRYDDYVMAFAEVEILDEAGTNRASGRAVRSNDSIEAGRWSRAHLVDGYTSRDPINEDLIRSDARRLEATLRSTDEEIRDLRLAEERRLAPQRASARAAAAQRLESARARLDSLPRPLMVYAAANDFRREGQFRPVGEGQARPVHVLERGDVSRTAAVAKPAGLSALQGVPSSFASDLANEGERRAALARWLTAPDNPLIWRSIANRVWQHHFGQGLVTTPNDFGKMGAQPSHPELLDWLACRLRDHGGSLKDLHRLLMTTPTWRQRADHAPASHALDASNRTLWKAPRRRLEAEALRDTVLAVAGTLDVTMGGPPYRPFGFKDDHSPHYLYEAYDPGDRSTWRRAIYRLHVRSVPDPFLETLDCPDPSRSVATRTETMTPLQALALLNDRFMIEQARRLAARVTNERGTPEGRIARAFQLAVGRLPEEAEASTLRDYAHRHGLHAACRLLFNLNEFLFID